MEQDLVPYQAVTRIPASRALVLAPHPDDETFGCGGAIAAHVFDRVPVQVVVLTDGAAYGDAQIRQQECRAACKTLGCAEPEFWNQPDRELAANADLAQRLAQRIAADGTDLLYAPSPWEIHPDHRQAAWLALRAAEICGVRVAFYEIGAPLRPNLLLDIGGWLDVKKAAAACYPSQQSQQDYSGQLLALNRYRTYTLPPQVVAAEAFLVLSAAELAQDLPRLLAAQPVSLGSAAAAAVTTQPLVSVLVRSIDRDTLQRALDSIAVQTYPNIEVVVVAAQPNHRPLAGRCGPFEVRLVSTEIALRRSQTANRALQAARGDLLIFLDDDDWLMPSHVARLAHVLQLQPQVQAAYAGVVMADPDGTPRQQVVDLPFDGVRQLAGNITPIHAVLFRRTLVAAGCRFDEDLDRYEDWDFWLQASRHTSFAHVPGVSAAYRIHESSGVHDDSGPQGAATQAIYEKWQTQWTPAERKRLMERAWHAEDLQQRVDALEADVQRARETLRVQNRMLADQLLTLHHLQTTLQETTTRDTQVIASLEHRVADLMGSTSWRVTAPLRWASERLRKEAAAAQPPAPQSAAAAQQPPITATAQPVLIAQPAEPVSAAKLAARYQPLPLRVFEQPAGAPARVTIVTDSINAGSLYGGVGTALILGALLARQRGARLRIVTRTQRAQPEGARMVLATYGIALEHEPEFAFAGAADETHEIDRVRDELFITTSWWTTAATLASVPGDSILYLLQEDERMFYPQGDEQLLCARTLASREVHIAVNSRLLYEHLLASGFANLAERGQWFEPAFPAQVFHRRERAAGGKKRLAFYARPHNSRNLFYFGLQVLEAAVTRGIVDLAQWDVVLVGREIPPLRLDAGAYEPQRLENLNWDEYAQLAGTTDLALCLMYTPHPSYPPFDMAASGSVVVTNRYGNKQDLSSYCANVLCGELDLESMLATLADAVALAQDDARRSANYEGAAFQRDWAQAFSAVLQQFGGGAQCST